MDWNERAKTVDPESRSPYLEEALLDHLEANRPELLEELGDQTPGYLTMMVDSAQRLEQTLIDQGTPKEVIRELVNDQLFAIPEE